MTLEAENNRKEAFTISMVDLFGCGFISAIFLFIANMLQPIIDSEQHGMAERGTAFGGIGLSGPVILTIESSGLITISDDSTAFGNLSGNKLTTIIPEATEINWPLKISFVQIGQNDPIDVTATLTMGSRSAVAYLRQFTGINNDDRATINFKWMGELDVNIVTKMPKKVIVGELMPDRRSSGYTTKFYLATDTDWNQGYILWASGMNRVAVRIKGKKPYVTRDLQEKGYCGVSLRDIGVGISCYEISDFQNTQINRSISRAIVYVCSSNSVLTAICKKDR